MPEAPENALDKRFGLIIGSGFDEFDGGKQAQTVTTRFGEPSAPIRMLDTPHGGLMTLARHGDGHGLPPHRINYRANLVALKELGVTAIVALNTVGVITRAVNPGELAVPKQILDYTWGREHTISDTDDVLHIDFTEPFTQVLRQQLLDAAAEAGIACHDGGVYAATQGPRLETAAEIDRLERDGADYVGMTGMPEAGLACELGLEYACLALIVNQAAGRGTQSIHEDLATSTLSARRRAVSVLQAMFDL